MNNFKSQIVSIVQHKMCSCCNVVTKGLFWMVCCCSGIANAQLLTRMGLNWCGQAATPEAAARTFVIVVAAWILNILFGWIEIIGLIFVIYETSYGCHLRKAMRTKYEIPTSNCGEAEDCCCMFWCSCCSSIQMARHTHDAN
jgi:Cys-rich protein (TIGR01571 family)